MIPIDQRSTTGPNITVHKVRVSKLPATKIFTTVFQVECTTRKIDNPISQRTETTAPILLPPGHSAFLLLTTTTTSTTIITAPAINNPTARRLFLWRDKEACYQQRNGETTDNNAKYYLSDQKHNVHAAGDASNSLIQASIARLALSILCGVGGPWSWIRLESAIPTLARASFSAPPLDRFKIAAWLALPSCQDR
jgi:hypothetical protein